MSRGQGARVAKYASALHGPSNRGHGRRGDFPDPANDARRTATARTALRAPPPLHPSIGPAFLEEAIRRIENNYVLPDMVAKAIAGMPTKRVMEWGQEQVVQAIKGQLKAAGS